MATTPVNAINESTSGVMRFSGTAFNASAITQHDVLIGGASNAITSVGPGSSGQVLQSGGGAADPSYSTATYPSTAGTSGNVLTSDGTNWISSIPNIQLSTTTLSSTDIQGMFATPITLISAPAAGKVINVVSFGCYYKYGGNNAFTAGGVVTITYNNAAGQTAFSGNIMTAAAMRGTANAYSTSGSATLGSIATTGVDGLPIVISNSTGAFTGNAAGDNTLVIDILYFITG